VKTLLVLADTPELSETLRAGLNPETYRVLHRPTREEAEPLIIHGLVNACIVDVEHANIQGLWLIQKLRRTAPKCPLLVFCGSQAWEWEEQAYVEGVISVLHRPVRPRVVNALLDRLWSEPERRVVPPEQPRTARPSPPTQETSFFFGPSGPVQTLGVLRGFSGILTHSLDAEAMLKQFLLLLRDILSINRAVIFLRAPLTSVGSMDSPDARGLQAASSVGVSSGLLQHFELSFDTGIGGHLFRTGRVLRRESHDAELNLEAQKEFELLGARVAVPILDRENVLGAAVFDGKITGEPLANEELQLIFVLLEQLGLAVKNIWLHHQVSANHQLLADIMRELGSACVVVGRDLAILHANRMARRYFGPGEGKNREMEFSDLPALLGGKVYQVLKTGAAVPAFRYEPEQQRGTVYSITIVPFQRQPEGLPASALLMAENITQSEHIKRLEVEAANLRLVKDMALRLVNEVGNAVVPLTLHLQVLDEKLKKKAVDPEFLKLMSRDLGEGVRRVTRLASQMRFLARDELLSQETFLLKPLIEEAFEEARNQQSLKLAELDYDDPEAGVRVSGNRGAVKHALTELLLNALQANPAEPKVQVRVRPEPGGNGSAHLQIDVIDNGSGFTLEAIQKAGTPFFSTRVVGVGLGLAVCRKILETHHGRLEIVPSSSGCVRISLPTTTE
jgi:signal transduction histidine kinase/ActR/RegA family two-component response regulator